MFLFFVDPLPHKVFGLHIKCSSDLRNLHGHPADIGVRKLKPTKGGVASNGVILVTNFIKSLILFENYQGHRTCSYDDILFMVYLKTSPVVFILCIVCWDD
jgi:hypothetical protein